jgi:hypothetical protein
MFKRIMCLLVVLVLSFTVVAYAEEIVLSKPALELAQQLVNKVSPSIKVLDGKIFGDSKEDITPPPQGSGVFILALQCLDTSTHNYVNVLFSHKGEKYIKYDVFPGKAPEQVAKAPVEQPGTVVGTWQVRSDNGDLGKFVGEAVFTEKGEFAIYGDIVYSADAHKLGQKDERNVNGFGSYRVIGPKVIVTFKLQQARLSQQAIASSPDGTKLEMTDETHVHYILIRKVTR